MADVKKADEAKTEKAPEYSQVPKADEKQPEAEKPKTETKSASKPKVDEEQARRDAHYFENGVNANGKGGVAPETE